MKNFFRELRYCEHQILEVGYSDLVGQESYSDETKNALLELIDFVESGNFIKAKSGKFIASHFRMTNSEMTETWCKTFRKKKEENTIRGQISETSRVLYGLFGEAFSEELLENKSTRIQSILDSFKVCNTTFEDLFINGVSERIKKSSDSKLFEVADLSAEMAFLAKYKHEDMEQEMLQLDQAKLSYIKEVLKKPLVVDYKINEEKVRLLNEICQKVGVSENVDIDIELPAGSNAQIIGDVAVPTVLVEILSEYRDVEGQVEEKAERDSLKKEVVAVLSKYTIAMIRKDFEELNPIALREIYKAIISEMKGFQNMLSRYQAILYESTFNKDTIHTALSHINCAED